MKKLILLLFVFGLLACGGKKEETKAVEEAVEQAAPSMPDTAAVVDSAASAVEEVAK